MVKQLISILLFLIAAVTASSQTLPVEPGVSLELAKWRAAHYSDVRYKLNLTLEKMSPVLKGTMEIRVNLKSSPPYEGGVDAALGGRGGSLIILDWRKIKGYEDRSTISNVSVNGRAATLENHPAGETPPPRSSRKEGSPDDRPLTFIEQNEHLIFSDGVQSGENVIKLDFTSPILTSGSAITRYVDKEDGAEYIYSLFVPSDASTAFPVFDQPDLKAYFDLEVDVPRDWNVISNGVKMFSGAKIIGYSAHDTYQHPPIPANLYRHTFTNANKPISTYVFAFAAGPFERVSVPGAIATGALSATTSKSPVATAPGTDQMKPRNVKPELKEAYKRWLSNDVSVPTGGNPTGSERVSSPHVSKGSAAGDEPSLTVGLRTPATNIYVRKSQAGKFQPHAAEVFRLNREAVKYFEEYFDYKFPFPKYDLVLIPEFPFGGMEHAGATFLREASIIFPQEPTRNDHISRATLMFHEAAHQWFGDTVTMRWFDDLWLKEGFANFAAYKAMERIMPEANAWKVFYERIKQGAYQTDSTKGTTPIYQEIKNLSAAKSAYGNIVYNKAPAFLRQAEFYLGEDKFQTAVRAFLKKHEFGNAGWQDLVREFEVTSKMDLTDFAKRWVTQPGMPKLFIPATPGYVQNFGVSIFQRPVIPFTGLLKDMPVWKEKSRVLLLQTDGKTLFTDITHVSGPTGTSVTPAGEYKFVFPNYQDYGYGIFLLDDKSRDYVLKNIQNEKDPFLRAMMWGSLWDSVREGELDPREYIDLVTKNLPTESDETIISSVLGRATTALNYYVSDKTREALVLQFENVLIERLTRAETLGQRITVYRALLNVAATANGQDVLRAMLRASLKPQGNVGAKPFAPGIYSSEDVERILRFEEMLRKLPLKTKDKFDIVTRLLILGDPDAPKLLTDLERTETTDEAKRYAYAARAGIATAENKAKYWNDFVNNKEISESWIEAAFGPWNSIRHSELTLPYLQKALQELPNHKRSRKIFFVNGWLGAFIGGQRSEEALAIVNKFLADNPSLDNDLRLKILENVDVIERAVKIRAKYGKN